MNILYKITRTNNVRSALFYKHKKQMAHLVLKNKLYSNVIY